MLSWLRRRHVRPKEVEAEADALIRSLGMAAYSAARRREHEASSDALAKYWNRVALAVAHKTGKRIGLDTSTPHGDRRHFRARSRTGCGTQASAQSG